MLLQAPVAEPAEEPPPEIRAIQVTGASVYDHDAVLRIVRLRPGQRLYRTPAAVAQTLETRYRDMGYSAATVAGAFEPAAGVLTLTVDEGRIVAVTLEGMEGTAQVRAVQASGLVPGNILREREVWAGLDRLGDASENAVIPDDPSYRVDSGPDGPRLTLRVSKRSAAIAAGQGAPGGAPLFDRVDGWSPGLGARLRIHDFRSYNHTDLYARGAYGFSSDRAHFAVGASRPFGGSGRLVLAYEFHDLTDSDDAFRNSAFEETLAAILFRLSSRDYFARRGHEAFAFWRLSRRAHLGVGGRSDEHSSLAVTSRSALFPRDDTPRANPDVAAGSMRSLVGALRVTSDDALYDTTDAERESFLLRSLYGAPFPGAHGFRLQATLEVADADALGGDFTFRRFVGDFRGRQPLGGLWAVATRGLLGLSGGILPPQKRFALGGTSTLRGFRIKELGGENLALASVEVQRESRFPRPGIAVFTDLGTVWSRDVDGSRMEADAGVGLFWTGPGGFHVRVDAAVPLTTSEGRHPLRVTVRLQPPF